MNLFVKNITQLATVAAGGNRVKAGRSMGDVGLISGAGVYCKEGKIAWVGPMTEWDGHLPDDVSELDASGMSVIPGFVDSHTHALFAGSREDEFALRAAGATYEQIAEQGGGILSTVRHVRAATKRELKRTAARFFDAMMKHGTTTVEVKSGYGLDFDSEVKMLEAIHELRAEEMIGIVPTFLGAHAVPAEHRDARDAYIRLVIDRMIPYVGKKSLAVFCDVFCEQGFFSLDETEKVLTEGKRWGLKPKIHADELTGSGGAELAVKVGAVSADHLERISRCGIEALSGADVVATLLPGVSFFLHHSHAPARALIDAGVPVALASDFNPGSCMSFSMPMMMTIACTQMGMSPAEALTSATLNGAAALDMSSSIGSIEVGKQADLVVVDVPDYRFVAYHFGVNHVRHTIKNGTLLEF